MVLFQQFGIWVDIDFLCRVLGVLGFVAYMSGYTALQLRLISGEGVLYSSSKVVGAFLVLCSLTVDFNLSAALIQVSFLLIGVAGIYLRLRERGRREQMQTAVVCPWPAEPARRAAA